MSQEILFVQIQYVGFDRIPLAIESEILRLVYVSLQRQSDEFIGNKFRPEQIKELSSPSLLASVSFGALDDDNETKKPTTSGRVLSGIGKVIVIVVGGIITDMAIDVIEDTEVWGDFKDWAIEEIDENFEVMRDFFEAGTDNLESEFNCRISSRLIDGKLQINVYPAASEG